MNFKTTVVLFILVLAVGAGILLLKTRAPVDRPLFSPAPVNPTEDRAEPLVPKSFGDPTEIAVEVQGQPQWKFARQEAATDAPAGAQNWRMTAPFEGPAQRWLVEQIASTLKRATCALKYSSGQGGMTLAGAGLEPPRAVVTLVDTNGTQVVVRVGRHEGEGETWVALGDDATIYRVQPSLKTLLKKQALEYLDQKLFDTQAERIVRLEITETPEDGAAQTCVLVKSGSEWVFEAPARAKAVGDKVRKLAGSFANLRVGAWVSDQAENAARYGLDPAALLVRATVEEPTPKPTPDPEAPDGAEEAAPAPVTKVYEVRFSRAHPLNEDTKVYAARGGDKLVGTVLQTVADGFKPDLKEWRDNRLTELDVSAATRLEWTVGGQSVALLRTGASWSYEDSKQPADRVAVEKVLQALAALRAVNFVDVADAESARFGFDAPQADLVLTLPKGGEPVRILVGGYADPDTQRLVYMRAGSGGAVAKVQLRDAQPLLGPVTDLRDRTVVEVDAARVQAVSIERSAAADSKQPGPLAFTLTRDGAEWKMTAPVSAPANTAQVDTLLKSLSNLRAERIVDAAGGLAQYGLDQPSVRLNYTYLPPESFKLEPEEPAEGEPASTQPARMVPKPFQPPAETLSLALARRDDQVYALRSENPAVVYALAPALWDELIAEYRATALLQFDAAQASTVTLRSADKTTGFRRKGTGDDKWEYIPEADIPIDGKKVANYLVRVADIKAVRYVEYQAADLAQYGLDAPEYELIVEVNGQPGPTLLISAARSADGGRFARLADSAAVLVLPADADGRFQIKIDEFEPGP